MIGVRRDAAASSEVDMNRVITPMLDLAFQVLLFFIFTYHPSQVEEGQMDLTLPDAAKAQAETPQQANPKHGAYQLSKRDSSAESPALIAPLRQQSLFASQCNQPPSVIPTAAMASMA